MVGHWREVGEPGDFLRRLSRPPMTDVQLRSVLSQDPRDVEFLAPGHQPLKEAFIAILDDNDNETYDRFSRTLSQISKLHDVESTPDAPLRRIPLIHGSITENEPGNISAGSYSAFPRVVPDDEDWEPTGDEPGWPATIFVTLGPNDLPELALAHEIGHYLDQQMLGEEHGLPGARHLKMPTLQSPR